MALIRSLRRRDAQRMLEQLYQDWLVSMIRRLFWRQPMA